MRRDLVVIGGGAGGLVVASVAARLGLAVTLIERGQALGGDCLHAGCVPSKALLHAARVAWTVRHARRVGLDAVLAPVDLSGVMNYVQRVVARVQEHDDAQRFRALGCEVLLGAPARFVSPQAVEVDGRRIEARRFVVATGSRPAIPPIPGLDRVSLLTNENVFEEPRLPARLVVLGGGPVGLELAQAFQRLGTRVTVLEQRARILPAQDPVLGARLRACLEAEGLDLRTGVEVTRVEPAGPGVRLVCRDGTCVEGDRLLVAAGRRPNVEGLGLDAAGIVFGPDGIETDRRQRTCRRHIYACGDVCGPYAFTHAAEHQAGVVLANAVFRLPRRVDYRYLPSVTFTDPELAQVGLTEAEAGAGAQVIELDFATLDRAHTDDEACGALRLVIRRGRVLGAALLAPHAEELIHELALGMRKGLRVRDLAEMVHAYPTRSQIHRRAAQAFYAGRLFGPGSRRWVRALWRLLP